MLFHASPFCFNIVYIYPQLTASKAVSCATASEFDTTTAAAASEFDTTAASEFAAAALAEAQRPIDQSSWSSYNGRQEPDYGECEDGEHYGFSNR